MIVGGVVMNWWYDEESCGIHLFYTNDVLEIGTALVGNIVPVKIEERMEEIVMAVLIQCK